jgi:hypothetical protein
MRNILILLALLLAPGISSGSDKTASEDPTRRLDTSANQHHEVLVAQSDSENCPDPSRQRAVDKERWPDNCPELDVTERVKEEPSWTIGELELITDATPNPELKVRSAGRSSLRSYNFVGKVGGVSFEQVAVPDAKTATQPIALAYVPNAPDGDRLKVKVGATMVAAKIPDWLLIPIVHFANSNYTAAVSLFGDGPEKESFFYIQYHPAFTDSLLGLRLLQADILLMDMRQNRSLPKRDGQVVLGHGEALPNGNVENDAEIAISAILRRDTFSSWILTDTETSASFRIQDGFLEISSSPYYHFWRPDQKSIDQHQRSVNDFNNRVKAYNQRASQYKSHVNTYNSLVARFNANNASVKQTTLEELALAIERDESDLAGLEQDLERIRRDVEEEVAVTPVPQITVELKESPHLLEALNPAIHMAVKMTAGYAAFFRYVKLEYPEQWETFLESIADVKTRPAVNLPTRMPKNF